MRDLWEVVRFGVKSQAARADSRQTSKTSNF